MSLQMAAWIWVAISLCEIYAYLRKQRAEHKDTSHVNGSGILDHHACVASVRHLVQLAKSRDGRR